MQVVVAVSSDLQQWHLTGQTLLPRRPDSFDSGLVEPGPPPLALADGTYLVLYNSASHHNDRGYHVGAAIVDGRAPSPRVLYRSHTPLLSWPSRSWMVGNDTQYLCNVPEVVFLAAARPLPTDTGGGEDKAVGGGEDKDELGRFELFFGGADAVVGRAVVVVSTGSS